MAREPTELSIPLNEGERETIIAPERLFQPGKEAYRDNLEALVFTGLGDVEKSIQEFNEVRAITQWPPWVAPIKLRRVLTGQAKPYGQRSSINVVFAALFTKTTPQGKHTTPRPRYHSEETGTDRVQRPARNTTTALHLGRLHPIPQQLRPSPPAPGKGGHHYRSRISGRKSLPPGPATLRNSTDLPTGDSAS